MTPRTEAREEAPSRTTEHRRIRLLRRMEARLELPLAVLGLAWLVILIVELVHGPSPFIIGAGSAIWIVFIADFVVKFILAPRKVAFLESNWLTALSLLLPALRILRVARAVALIRGGRLVRVVASVNRSMHALGRSMHRRGFGYVMAITLVVMLGGAAGMYAFEQKQDGFANYASAVYWTIMLMTTMGSDYWPQTPEGRVLCVLLSIYSIAVFGYITASLATHFIDRDAADTRSAIAGDTSIRALREEVAGLRQALRSANTSASMGEKSEEDARST